MGMDLGKPAGKLGRARPNMNVTPLVDVVLVLLIVFMVVTPMLAKQFWVHLPDKEKKEPTPSNDDAPIVVSVAKNGDIRIDRETVPQAEFSGKLHRVLAAKQQRTVFFDADEEAEFGDAVRVMDLARGGGADTIAVLTEPLAH